MTANLVQYWQTWRGNKHSQKSFWKWTGQRSWSALFLTWKILSASYIPYMCTSCQVARRKMSLTLEVPAGSFSLSLWASSRYPCAKVYVSSKKYSYPEKWLCIIHFVIRHACTWVDQKALKLVAYLLKYTSELYQTYTVFATTISWFISVVRMTHYARRYMTSSFDDVMQQWPGVKNVRNCLFPAKCYHQHLCFTWQLFFSRL